MDWTYGQYQGMNIGICAGLGLVTFIAVLLAAWSSDVKFFVIQAVIGLDLDDLEETDPKKLPSNHSVQENISSEDFVRVYNYNLHKKDKKKIMYLTWSFRVICAVILAIMPILIFDGCILGSTGLGDADNCPDDPMDCFVFASTTTLSPSMSFKCLPGSITNFSTALPNGYAWCYGWIIKRQTTKRVLDQLGICSGLIGLFATILALFVYLGKNQLTLYIVSALAIACIIVTIILFAVYKWSLTFLTYATLTLCLFLSVWGAVLTRIFNRWNKELINATQSKYGQPRYVESEARENRKIRRLPPLDLSVVRNLPKSNEFPKQQ